MHKSPQVLKSFQVNEFIHPLLTCQIHVKEPRQNLEGQSMLELPVTN
ncbi:uncharacterized protein METZ01_LOCUS170551, partial [marine metagenome]